MYNMYVGRGYFWSVPLEGSREIEELIYGS